MDQPPAVKGRQRAGYGQRFFGAVVLLGVSLLWLTEDLSPWTKTACWTGTVVGAAAALYFGLRHLRSRSDS